MTNRETDKHKLSGVYGIPPITSNQPKDPTGPEKQKNNINK
jgi:hypothetical protein